MSPGFDFATMNGSRPADMVRAMCVRHRFRRHLHRQGVVCRIDAGVRCFALAGAEELTAAGDVVVIPAGVPHAAEPVRDETHSYRVISCAGAFPAVPKVLRDRQARTAFDRTWARLRKGDAAAAEALVALLMILCQVRAPTPRRDCARIARVRARIEEDPSEPLTLRTLSEDARMNPFTLHRAFRERYGLPPHEYLQLVRVRRAQEELRRGARPLADLALDLGFADQAHLTRVFKRYVGVPPGFFRDNARR